MQDAALAGIEGFEDSERHVDDGNAKAVAVGVRIGYEKGLKMAKKNVLLTVIAGILLFAVVGIVAGCQAQENTGPLRGGYAPAEHDWNNDLADTEAGEGGSIPGNGQGAGEPMTGERTDASPEEALRILAPIEHIELQLDHYASAYERIAAIPERPLEDAEMDVVVGYFSAGEPYESIRVLVAHVADGELRDRIVEVCGEDDFAARASANLPDEGEGFVDYLTRSYGVEYAKTHAAEIETALKERGIS